MAELALDDVQRHALAGELERVRVRVTQLVQREPPSDAGDLASAAALAVADEHRSGRASRSCAVTASASWTRNPARHVDCSSQRGPTALPQHGQSGPHGRPVDVAVLNVGIATGGAFADTALEDHLKVHAVNVAGTTHMAKSCTSTHQRHRSVARGHRFGLSQQRRHGVARYRIPWRRRVVRCRRVVVWISPTREQPPSARTWA